MDGYSGDAGNGMMHSSGSFQTQNNKPFTTFDNDNDVSPHNCATRYQGMQFFITQEAINLKCFIM